jgi:hypothetical protein
MRDRNVRLPWVKLRPLLDQIARANGSMDAYRQVVASGRHVVDVAPGGPAWFWGMMQGVRRLLLWQV